MNDLIAFLRARLDETERAIVAYRDHRLNGQCENFDGAGTEHYDEWDSCWLHVKTGEAMPYGEVEFGLADVASKREIIAKCERIDKHHMSDDFAADQLAEDVLESMALPFSAHPDYREGWRPRADHTATA